MALPHLLCGLLCLICRRLLCHWFADPLTPVRERMEEVWNHQVLLNVRGVLWLPFSADILESGVPPICCSVAASVLLSVLLFLFVVLLQCIVCGMSGAYVTMSAWVNSRMRPHLFCRPWEAIAYYVCSLGSHGLHLCGDIFLYTSNISRYFFCTYEYCTFSEELLLL